MLNNLIGKVYQKRTELLEAVCEEIGEDYTHDNRTSYL